MRRIIQRFSRAYYEVTDTLKDENSSHTLHCYTQMPTHSRRKRTPKPINTDATSATSNSLNTSRVNFVDVTSYLSASVNKEFCIASTCTANMHTATLAPSACVFPQFPTISFFQFTSELHSLTWLYITLSVYCMHFIISLCQLELFSCK